MNFERNGVGASKVVCPAGHWPTAQAFLCAKFPFVSADSWRLRFEQGSVFALDGTQLAQDAPYISGQTICYFRENVHEKKLPFQERIIYQDDCLIVADKPHFLPVVPSGQYVQETLLARLKRSLALPDLSPIHRIDRDTAGLVLFSVQIQHRAAYQNLFRDGLVSKQYQAIAPYDAQYWQAQTLPVRIANRLESAPHFMQMQQVSGAINAVTHVVSVEPLLTLPELARPELARPSLARYTLRPLTGKRHQLRVHMLGLGAPILGDAIYPELMPERDVSLGDCPALQLLAQSLRFIDPISGQQRVFTSERVLSLGSV